MIRQELEFNTEKWHLERIRSMFFDLLLDLGKSNSRKEKKGSVSPCRQVRVLEATLQN